MNSFSRNSLNGVTLWVGNPDCQAAHDAILMWLKNLPSTFRSTASTSDKILKGNLGEAISFCVGFWNDFRDYRAFPANAFKPLGLISKPDLDIVWIFFGNTVEDDVAVFQEVKTTGEPSLDLADELVKDYDKLFGTNPDFTLRSRLDALKNEFEYKLKLPELCPRVLQLAGNSPRTSPKVRLIPTLVHERNGSDPQTKMIAIRSTLCSGSSIARSWSTDTVEAWAIGLSDLNNRLIRLALGQN